MGISKNKKEQTQVQEQELDIKIRRAKDMDPNAEEGCNIAFDADINGVTIYGMFYREGKDKNGKDYTMVSFPSHKGKDGKYYSYAYVKLSDAQVEFISNEIEKVLNA